jgi:hypothetical protein
MAGVDEFGYDRRADEARRPSDEYPHEFLLMSVTVINITPMTVPVIP